MKNLFLVSVIFLFCMGLTFQIENKSDQMVTCSLFKHGVYGRENFFTSEIDPNEKINHNYQIKNGWFQYQWTKRNSGWILYENFYINSDMKIIKIKLNSIPIDFKKE